ncbi:MAG: hypothetical protein ACI87O_002038 [Planctomycetota bacterium]|jgi:hypothetical protein
MSEQCNQAVEQAARLAIRQTFDTAEGEFGSTLFASHHLEELEESYWEEHIGTRRPSPEEILELIECRFVVDEEGEIERLDFQLPAEVSDYVLSVSVDEGGNVDEITMES